MQKQRHLVILVVEDDAAFARILLDLAHELDFDCVIANTTDEGMALARELSPTGILLDINLPDIDGYEVVRRLRASQKTALKRVPIIAVTANAMKGDAKKALEAGCNLYMSKPINIQELLDKVENFIYKEA